MRTLIIAVVLVLLVALPCAATITRVSSQDCTNTGASTTTVGITYPAATSASNLIIVSITATFSTGTLAVTGTGWTNDVQNGSNTYCATAILSRVGDGNTNYTFSLGVTATDVAIRGIEVSGLDLTGTWTDKAVSNIGAGSTTSPASASSGTTTVADEYAIAAFGLHGNALTCIGFSGSFTQIGTAVTAGTTSSLCTAERVLSATGSYSTTASVSGVGTTGFAAMLVTYKGPFVAIITGGTLPMMGVGE